MVGYRAQRQLAVKLYQLDKLSQLMDTALKAVWVRHPGEYGLKSPQVIKEAGTPWRGGECHGKARVSANQAFGMKLGKVCSVEYRNSSPCLSTARP